MPIKLANNASGTLATAISASDTGIALTTGDGAEFPTLGAGDYFYATITSSGGTQEIVKATARSGDSLTVVRAQEGTTAASFAAGSRFELRVTAGSVEDYVEQYAELGVYTPAGGSAVATTVQTKLREVVSVKDFGAVGDGVTDDTAALQNFFNAGGNLYLPEGTYRYSYLEFNTAFSMTGNGVLRYDGSAPTTGTASIQINAAITADALRISSSGAAESAFGYIEASSDNIRIELLEMKADAQRNQTGGANFYGSNLFVGQVVAENVARPIAFQPPSTTTNVRTNIHLGSLVAKNYIRGLALSYADNWSVGSVHVETRWAGAVVTPGYNGILLQACNDWTIGKCYIADAPEHSFRIGGDADTTNFSIGQITSVNSAGCAMKFNVSVGNLVKNGQVGQLVAINTGEGIALGNKEVVRLTRTKAVTFGSVTGLVWVTNCFAIQDVEDLTVGEVYAENVSARVIVTRTDYDDSTGNVDGVTFGTVVAYMQNTARAAYGFTYEDGARTIGNIVIENSFVTGFSNFLVTVGAANIYSGPIFIRARSLSTDPVGGVEDVTDTDLFQVNWTRGPWQYQGKAFGLTQSAQNTFQAGQFVNAITVNQNGKGVLFFRSSVAAPAKDVYGAGMAFSRLNSDRRGAAVVAKQTGNDAFNMGLAFLCAANSTATDLLFERMVLKHNITLWVALQTFADNAAALAGGLVAGDTYKTATGEVRIVV